jgi:hypothetical protein
VQLRTEIISLALTGCPSILDAALNRIAELQASDKAVVRWGIVNLTEGDALLEVATVTGVGAALVMQAPAVNEASRVGIHVALVIPTGVGADVGGFIGDAGPVARALEAVADSVIVHPNVVNAADFYGGSSRTLYVDGLTLDRFFAGELQLGSPQHSKIGVILDQLEPAVRARTVNSINGVRAVRGLDIVGYIVCREKVRSHISRSAVGHYVGSVENPAVLFEAAEALRNQGANALAVVTATEGIARQALASHYAGDGPNPIGALEALISRSITWKTGLPCAHAPAFVGGLGTSSTLVDPRAAAEVASGSGLPCLLYGLAQAPRMVGDGGIKASDLAAVIVPFQCAGGSAALPAHRFGVPLLAVKANTTSIGARADLLRTRATIVGENYAEAIGFVACAKAGVSWSSIHRPLTGVNEIAGTLHPTSFRAHR